LQNHSRSISTSIRTRTQDRLKLRDELEKALADEDDHVKYAVLQRRQEFGKIITKNYIPEVSQKKREEMQKIISVSNSSARERVKKIKYERPKDSILNYVKFPMGDTLDGEMNGRGYSADSHDNTNSQYAKTLAFGQREDSGGECSPSRAYIPSGELEPVKEVWQGRKKVPKQHNRSKSSLDKYMNRSGEQSYGDMYSHHRSSARVIEPEDWLQKRRNIRMEKGGEYMYRSNLPKQLSKDKFNSFHEIKSLVESVERQASKIEMENLDKDKSTNLLRDNVKVGSMYVDAIRAKAALIEQL